MVSPTALRVPTEEQKLYSVSKFKPVWQQIEETGHFCQPFALRAVVLEPRHWVWMEQSMNVKTK